LQSADSAYLLQATGHGQALREIYTKTYVLGSLLIRIETAKKQTKQFYPCTASVSLGSPKPETETLDIMIYVAIKLFVWWKVTNMFFYKEVKNMYRGQKYIKLQNSAICKWHWKPIQLGIWFWNAFSYWDNKNDMQISMPTYMYPLFIFQQNKTEDILCAPRKSSIVYVIHLLCKFSNYEQNIPCISLGLKSLPR